MRVVCICQYRLVYFMSVNNELLRVSVQGLWKQTLVRQLQGLPGLFHAKFNDLGRGYSLVGVI